jgi:thiamine pyrophosphate-dependent acetolactate synthase large subunit-like protein
MTVAPNKIARRPFVAEVLRHRGDALIASGLGSATWDCFAAGDRPEYLYSWGGMGLAVPTALGVALAQPGRRVVAITGDGELMMGLGSLAVVGDRAPKNLAVLVLDNEKFGETGRQRGLTSGRTDIAAMAKACGFRETMTVTEQGAAPELARFLFTEPGPYRRRTVPPSPTASASRSAWRSLDRTLYVYLWAASAFGQRS